MTRDPPLSALPPLSPRTLEHLKSHRDVYRLQDTFNADPRFEADYQLLEKIGEGTFSSVYRALDKRAHKYRETYRTGDPGEDGRDSADGADDTVDDGFGMAERRLRTSARTRRLGLDPHGPTTGKRYVAIKRIYATSAPFRILNELELLYQLRGSVHVSTVICTHRIEDQVLAVLPYQEHTDFRLWYTEASHLDCQIFAHDLLMALEHVHSKDIIHRDVKPSNFLWDHRRRRGVLCDFGLAAVYDYDSAGKCKHPRYILSHHDHRRGNTLEESHVHLGPSLGPSLAAPRPEPTSGGHKAPSVPKQDTRPSVRANRAGTRGFRAPEVLLKCPDQSVAIDLWSVGVTLLSLFTARFPFFQSNDDNEALMEVAHLLGKRKMKACASQHNRIFHTNVPDVTPNGKTFGELVQALNPRFFLVDVDEMPLEVTWPGGETEPLRGDAIETDTDEEREGRGEDGIGESDDSPLTRDARIERAIERGRCFYADTPSIAFWEIADPERAWRTGERDLAAGRPARYHHHRSRYTGPERYAIKLYATALHLLTRLLEPDHERRLTASHALTLPDSFAAVDRRQCEGGP